MIDKEIRLSKTLFPSLNALKESGEKRDAFDGWNDPFLTRRNFFL